MARIPIEGGCIELPRGCVLHRGKEPVLLTANERSLIRVFADRPGEDLTRAELLQEAWGYDPNTSTRALDTAMKVLRRKVEQDPKRPRHLLTVWGVGYRFEPEERSPSPGYVGPLSSWTALNEALDRREPLITLWGPVGIGKTRLARERFASDPEALWVSLLDAEDEEALPSVLARQLPGGVEGPWEGVRILVLDNAEHVREALSSWVDRWIRAQPELTLVLTSRTVLGHASEHVIRLARLPDPDARRLLEVVHPIEEGPALDRVLEMLGGLPLALKLTRRRLGVFPIEAVADRLEDPEFLRTEDGKSSADSMIASSVELLSPSGRGLLSLASLFASSFSIDDLEHVSGRSSVDALTELVEASMVESIEGSFHLLPIVRQVVRRLIPAPSEVQEHHAASIIERSNTPKSAASRLPDLLRIARSESHHPSTVIGAALAIRNVRGMLALGLGVQIAKRAIALAPQGTKDQQIDLKLLECSMLLATGNAPLEPFEQALALAKGTDREGWAMSHLGSYHRHHGEPSEARRWLREACSRDDTSPYQAAVIWIERAFAERPDHMEECVSALEQALAHAHTAEDSGMVGRVLISLGGTLMMMHRLRPAGIWLEQAITVHRTHHLAHGLWHTQINLAWHAAECEDFERAYELLEHCRADAEGRGAYNKGVLETLRVYVSLAMDDVPTAMRSAEEARKLVGIHGDKTQFRAVSLADAVWRLFAEHPGAEACLDRVLDPDSPDLSHQYALGYRAWLRGEAYEVPADAPGGVRELAAALIGIPRKEPGLHGFLMRKLIEGLRAGRSPG